jgi:hypothetical protein
VNDYWKVLGYHYDLRCMMKMFGTKPDDMTFEEMF